MKRLFYTLILSLLICSQALAGDFIDFPNFPARGQGPFDKGYWWESGLTFYAPFDNPADPLRLIKGTDSLSFTRATTATYTPAGSTTMATAASGQLRIEANGALIEGQRTNLAKQSESFNTTWQTSNITVSVDNVVAPNGATSAERIDWVSTSGNGYLVVVCPVDNDTTYTFSFYGMSVGATNNKVGYFYNDNPQSISGITLTTTWAKYSVTFVNTTGTGNSQIGFYWRTPNIGSVHSVYIWGAQLEAGSFPSSYIPTTTAVVTRNLSSLSVASSGNIDNTAGTFYTSWTPNIANTVAASGNYYIFDAGGLEAYWNSTDDKIYLTDGTNTISTAALTFSVGAAKDVAFTWGAAGLSITVDGTDTTGATYTASVFGASAFFGADTTPANLLYGHHKNTRIWNRQFSVAERGTIAP